MRIIFCISLVLLVHISLGQPSSSLNSISQVSQTLRFEPINFSLSFGEQPAPAPDATLTSAVVPDPEILTEGGVIATSPSSSLLSDLVFGIDEELAEILDFGRNLGRKIFPPDAYIFVQAISVESQFESVPVPLTQQEIQELQGIIDECPVNPQKAEGDFVTVEDGQFKLSGANFQFLGFNSYQVVRQQISETKEVANLFSRAQQLGLKVCRVWLFSDDIRRGPFEWDESIFRALDAIINTAGQYDIKLVLAFANYWEHFTGTEQYVFWAHNTLTNKTIEDFYLDYRTRLLYMSHVCKVVNRINTVSGVRWRDDPTIMAWNLMNEPRCPGCSFGGSISYATSKWIDEMSEFIKSIDPNHLITTGMEGFSTDESGSGHFDNPGSWAICQGTDFIKGHSSSNIDYATIHVYPEHKTWDYDTGSFCDANCQIDWSQQYFEARIEEASKILNKPLVLEEFGMSIKMRYRVSNEDGGYFEQAYSRQERLQMYKTILDTMLSGEGASGVMFWMAITGNYPDYDGFSIEIDDSISFEGQNPPDYNILQQFRKKNEQDACVNARSSWRPNPKNLGSLSVQVEGNSVVEVLSNAAAQILEGSVPDNGGSCTDIPPNNEYTCAQQQEWGKCNEDWMVSGSFCQKTCNRCDTPTTVCNDVPPNAEFTCEQQKDFGKCEESWMISGNYCESTCGKCSPTTTPIPTPTPDSTPSPSPSVSPSPVSCEDVAPGGEYTCAQQKEFGKCDADWMLSRDFCAITCGRCLPQGCSDIAPDNTLSCEQQKGFEKCDESWMLTGGFCAQTCERC